MTYQEPVHCKDWNPKFGPGFKITRAAFPSGVRTVEVVRASWVTGWYDVTGSRPGFMDCMTERQILESVRADNPVLADMIEAQGITLTDSDRRDDRLMSGEIDRIAYNPIREFKNGREVKYG